jgi:hypothetical protein
MGKPTSARLSAAIPPHACTAVDSADGGCATGGMLVRCLLTARLLPLHDSTVGDTGRFVENQMRMEKLTSPRRVRNRVSQPSTESEVGVLEGFDGIAVAGLDEFVPVGEIEDPEALHRRSHHDVGPITIRATGDHRRHEE